MFLRLLSLFFVFSLMSLPIDLDAQSQDKKVTYKKARALQTSTAKKIVKVVEALERVDEEGKEDPDFETVKEVLNELLEKKENLRSYDRSVMWNYYGYIYFTEERYTEAMQAYRNLLAEPESTIPLRVASLYTLAQLNFVNDDFEQGIKVLLQWMDEVEVITAQGWSLLSQAYFQVGADKKSESEKLDFFEKALESMLKAVQTAEIEEYKPKENWYVLMAACYSELESRIGKDESLYKQLGIYEILVNLYPKKMYFIQLGGIYSQLSREIDYMVTLKAAYQKDLLDKQTEYLTLASLLLQNNNPYWAAKVLEDGRKKKVPVLDEKTKEEKILPVVKDNEKNLKLLADAWRMAQEMDLAIPIMEKAAKLAKDGQTYIILGSLYLSEDKLEEAVLAIEEGLKKGKVKNSSQARLTLGQAHFELQNFDKAKKEFRIAARNDDKKIKKTANSWIKYTENEEIRVKNLALRRDYIQNQG
jgi:tetratricopeptide (TPR) repeat protein